MTSPTSNGDASTASGGWFKVQNAVVDRMAEVGVYGYAVYGVILKHADRSGMAFPSAATIARLTKMSRRRVFSAVVALEQAGWVRIERGFTKNGHPEPNRYHILSLGNGEPGALLPPVVGELGAGVGERGAPDGEPGAWGSAPRAQEQDPSNKTHSTRPKEQKGKRAACEVVVPEGLIGSEEFQEEWKRWLTYRTKRKLSKEPMCLESQLAMLADLGIHGAIESIQASIRNGWQGLFPAKENANGRTGQPGADGRDPTRIRSSSTSDAIAARLAAK